MIPAPPPLPPPENPTSFEPGWPLTSETQRLLYRRRINFALRERLSPLEAQENTPFDPGPEYD